MATVTTIGFVALLLLGIIIAMMVATFFLNPRTGFAVLLVILILVLLVAALLLLGGATYRLGILVVIGASFFLALTGLICALVARLRSPPRPRPTPKRRTDIPDRGRMTPPTRAGHCPACGTALPTDAPEGLCPRCLLQSGLANPSPSPSLGGTTPHPGPFVAPAPADLAPHFPQLEILELVGQGGMGAVYKARQTKLDRLVALKILPPEWGGDPAFAERFSREARALARLNHPHIVAVHDFGETGGLFYLLMEFVDGGNLRQRLQDGPLAPEQALAVIPQLCDALEYAHEEGIVHRDVKPENILLDRRGRAKIADFGLAKLLGKPRAEFTLTASHQVMGTLDYMAPEQRQRPLEIDHRADIYSLGVVFYEMLTGELPLGRFAPPSRRTGVDARIDEVLFRALETDPEQRYQSAGAFKTDLQSGGAEAPAAPAGAELMHRPSPRAAEGARRRVRGPATGLLVTGILQCMCLTGFGISLASDAGGRLHFDDHGMPFISGMSTNDRIGGALLLGWCILGLLAGAVLIQAGLRMMGHRSYRLALLGSVLAMLPISPMFVFGLPLGSWALAVLCEPEVEAAFADEARRAATFRNRRLAPQPTGPVRRRVRSFFRSVRSLMLYSSPKQAVSSPAASAFANPPAGPGRGPEEQTPITAQGVASEARGAHNGPADRPANGRGRGFAWAVVLVVMALPLGSVVVCTGYFGLARFLVAEQPATPAAGGAGGGGLAKTTRPSEPIRAAEWQKAPVKVSPNWREGPTGLAPELVRDLGLSEDQGREVLKALQLAYQEYLRLETQHSKRDLDDGGHLHVHVSDFAKDLAALENRTWTQLDKALTPDQRGRARTSLIRCLHPLLGLSAEPRMIGELLPTKSEWDVEIWRVGTWYHWRVQRPTTGNQDLNLDIASGSGPELPFPWQRFWRDGKP
jgi:tRNA A-37 threonylcarbamoyl transferase component Bud32